MLYPLSAEQVSKARSESAVEVISPSGSQLSYCNCTSQRVRVPVAFPCPTGLAPHDITRTNGQSHARAYPASDTHSSGFHRTAVGHLLGVSISEEGIPPPQRTRMLRKFSPLRLLGRRYGLEDSIVPALPCRWKLMPYAFFRCLCRHLSAWFNCVREKQSHPAVQRFRNTIRCSQLRCLTRIQSRQPAGLGTVG